MQSQEVFIDNLELRIKKDSVSWAVNDRWLFFHEIKQEAVLRQF